MGTRQPGLREFLVDTVPIIVPNGVRPSKEGRNGRSGELAKRGRSRHNILEPDRPRADETDDPALRAVQAFGRRLGHRTLISP